MTERTYTADEVQDLTDRVFLLRENLESGKMFFAPHLVDDFKRSYEAIRLAPDGTVDPATVDGRIRASTLALIVMRQREEAKREVSLAQIQEAYFSFLFRELGWLHRQMKESGANPAQVARVVTRDVDFVKSLNEALPNIVAELREFWSAIGDSAGYHLQDSLNLKATFAGDLFPAHAENVVSTAGLYVDTIILPCPIMRIAPLVGVMPPKQVVAYFVKHALTSMTYRDLAVTDVTPPIVLVVPSPDDTDTDRRATLVRRAEPAQCKHGEYLFRRSFESAEHLAEFCGDLIAVDQVLRELKGGDRLLFDTEWRRDPREQLLQTMATGHPLPPGMDPSIAGHHVLAACFGRMPQALGAQENAFHFGATPFINAETSWLYYTWLLEYEGNVVREDPQNRKSMHVVHALASEANNNLEWLGNVPPETILEIRKQGLAEELRALLGRGVGDLIGINPANYFRTADQVVENLEQAFRHHQKQLAEARAKKLKLFGIDVTSCIAVGGIAVTAALTSNPGLGALSGVLGVAGLPSLKDIKTKLKDIVAEDRARRSSPTGLLFRHVDR